MTTLPESAGSSRTTPKMPSNTPLSATAKATANTAWWPRKRITARYKPNRTKIGMLTATTAHKRANRSSEGGRACLEAESGPQRERDHDRSVQMEMIRLVGRGKSTVART